MKTLSSADGFDRLAFIKKLILAHGLTVKEVATLMGYKAPASFRHSFSEVQDIDLSRAQRFIDQLGYDFEIKITGGNPVNTDQRLKLSVNQMQTLIGENFELSRLFFLSQAMMLRGETTETIARKLNRTPGSIVYYFRIDDIKLSVLYRIVWAMNASIEFVIKPKQSFDEAEDARTVRTSITLLDEQSFADLDVDESKVEVLMSKKAVRREARQESE